MGNVESADHAGDDVLTEEQFAQLSPERREQYIKYMQDKNVQEKKAKMKQGGQKSLGTKLGAKFAARNPISISPQRPSSRQNGQERPHNNPFERPIGLFQNSKRNVKNGQQHHHQPHQQPHPLHHQYREKGSPQSPDAGVVIQQPPGYQTSFPPPHHSISNRSNNHYPYNNNPSNINHSRAPHPNLDTVSNGGQHQHPQPTVNVLMYPATTTKRSKFLPDASKMFAKLSINNTNNSNSNINSNNIKNIENEDDDWESRWENDDNDDDSSEDEDKMPAHPFRPGIDSGHSSSSSIKRPPDHVLSSLPNGNNAAMGNNNISQQQQQLPHPLQPQRAILGTAGELWEDTMGGQLAFEKPGVNMFNMLRVLGKGSFGKVVLVRKRTEPDCGMLFAMKILRKSHLVRKNQIERTKTERNVLSVVDHPFIMKLHFAFQTEDKLYFVLEYCSGGELFFHLSRYRRFPERVARFYAAELLLAIGHLHRRGIIFRDLKPENVLLDAAGHVKLGDFGLSKTRISDPCQGAMSVCGTPEYMAPEVISRSGHGFCVDYWGLGMLVFEMMTSLPPWYTTNREELSRRLLSAPLEIPNYVGDVANAFITALLQRNPRRRLGVQGIRSVMEHIFFRDIQWKLLASKKMQPPVRPTEGWATTNNVNGNIREIPDGGDNRNQLELSDQAIADVTRNFHEDFTRMAVHTEDHTGDPHNLANGYDSEDLPQDTFVGFTFDEIDNHATTSSRSRSSALNRNHASPQASSSRRNQLL